MVIHNHFEVNIVKRFNKLLNIFLPIAIIGASSSAYLLYTSMHSQFLTLNYLLAGAACLILLVYKNKIDAFVTIYILIGLSAEISAITLILTPYTTSGLLILSISTLMVMGLLSRRLGLSYIVATTILLLLILFHHNIIYHSSQISIMENNRPSLLVEWSIYIITYIVYSTLLYITIFSIKNDLISSLISEEKNKATIENLAYYDHRTHLPNIYKIEKELKGLLPIKGYIALINISGLNLINSIYGKSIGDVIVEKSAYYLEKMAVEEDIIGRVGSNEFFWFMKHCDQNTAHNNLQDFMLLVQTPNNHFNVDVNIKYKMGLVSSDNDDTQIDSYLRKAYLALEEAKHSRKKNYILYDSHIEEKIQSKEKIKDLLSNAIANESFEIFYQEKIDCRTGEVIGLESLARWFPTDLGEISPSVFIPLIDEMSLSIDFGELIVKKVAKDIPLLMKKYPDTVKIAINISPIHLAHKSFVSFVEKTINNHNINPGIIMFEITEDSVIENMENISGVLSSLHAIGFNISIDDFGTGYSSLSYLSYLVIDELKIDQAFIREMFRDDKNIKLVQAIISLKSIYNINIVAEGVETQEQSQALQEMNCFIHQGFLFSKPQPLMVQDSITASTKT